MQSKVITDYLKDLADRLRAVPLSYKIDIHDVYQLRDLADSLDDEREGTKEEQEETYNLLDKD